MEKYDIRYDKICDIQTKIECCDVSSSIINIYGPSGTGKTFLIQEALEKYFGDDINATIIYLNLLEDILSSTAFWDMLLFTVWNGGINDRENMLRIDKKCSLSKYLQRSMRGKKVIKTLFQSITSIVASIPVYNAQIAVGGINTDNSTTCVRDNAAIEKSQLVIKYFKNISKKHKLILIIDNYQFMNPIIR